MCPLAKTIGMVKVIVGFHEAAQKTMSEFQGEHNIMWSTINNAMTGMITKITDMQFELPREREEYYKKTFVGLFDEVASYAEDRHVAAVDTPVSPTKWYEFDAAGEATLMRAKEVPNFDPELYATERLRPVRRE